MYFVQFAVFTVLTLFYFFVLATHGSAVPSRALLQVQRDYVSTGHGLNGISKNPKEEAKHEKISRVKRQAISNLMDVMSLTMNGDFYLADMIAKGKEMTSVAWDTVTSIFDFETMTSMINSLFDTISMSDARNGRNLVPAENKKKMKEGVTSLVGAAMGEQECLEKSACMAGEYASYIPGKEMLFLVMDRIVPVSWVPALTTLKRSATYVEDCRRYICNPDPEGVEYDA